MKLVLITLLALLFSCSETSTEKVELTDTDKALSFLEKKGFDLKDYFIEENHIMVGEDMAFDIDDLVLRFEKKNDSRQKQWHTEFQVDRNRINDVAVMIQSNVPSAWATRARAAMVQWNSVTGSRVYLYEVTRKRDADIIVKTFYSGSAMGTFPYSNGKVGKYIWVNPNYSPTGYYYNTMLHELGHNIGLRHDHAPSEGIDPSWQIAGTPYSDTYSVMSYNSNRYFTDMDKKAVEVLYPL